ncbi:MAG: chemotaxis protein [Candidatus Glassbacteria bacterium RIFCSPLOWO2_12_FULL_58_11]|uniref:Chemotaxis protein n=1 Tax=Candidatus Glassbacteria bacterium RIFCSPLOWO2_12_FULL_58_11 TaxID=1817867 RepID=A0A1F5YQA8_9BACT|nr:MAG: chemotaxis protein [Candidatus Glassbacteria bacterium RIFCSPLOWO2_12_FULL_58_11]
MAKAKKKLESASVEWGREPGPDEAKKILQARAHDLSRELVAKDAGGSALEVVVFILANETYAIETEYIREVYPLRNFTPLPCTPQFVLGLVNVRGQILSVIDIKKFFNLPEKGLTELNKIIILQKDGTEFGLLADLILGVRSIPTGTLQSPAALSTVINEKYLKGVTDERVVVLEADRLLSDPQIIVNEEVEA